jgi:TrkA family protein
MALVVLITAILISALVVKVGTVALTMTGMDRRKVAILFIYLLARWRGLDRRLTAEIEKRLRQTTNLRVANFEEAPLLTEGYGVVEVYVSEDSEIAHKSIGELRLRARGMAVLAVDRVGQIIPAPDAETMLLPGDRLICYGKVKSIEDIAYEKAPSLRCEMWDFLLR